MDLLIEKLDGSRYYLSQYKVLITEFEESAPSVTRNNMQLDQRNGNIDFGGWHKDKTINITGYYRADDMDEEEMLREKLYALLSDPDGYYITQLKTSPKATVERPGETSGNYYDRLKDYPSHKRFLVYTEAPEMELVGNVNGTLLYKLTAEFKTMKLPYGETPAVDIAIDSPYKDVPVNLLTGTSMNKQGVVVAGQNDIQNYEKQSIDVNPNNQYVYSTNVASSTTYPLMVRNYILWFDKDGKYISISIGENETVNIPNSRISNVLNPPKNASKAYLAPVSLGQTRDSDTSIVWNHEKLEIGTTASPWSPNPADPEYNIWYYKTDGTASIPYSGTVPCNQLEQQFAIELTAMGASSSLSFKIDDTEFTYSGGVASGDVFLLTGFSYTQNGLSIVSKTNKAYFILQPDKPNKITCNVPGTVKILGFQNLYA